RRFRVDGNFHISSHARGQDAVAYTRDERAQVQWEHFERKLVRRNSREVEELLHETELDARAARDDRNRPIACRPVEGLAREQVRPAQDRVNRSAKIMRQYPEETIRRPAPLLEALTCRALVGEKVVPIAERSLELRDAKSRLGRFDLDRGVDPLG